MHRFFYHFHKGQKCMSVHFMRTCFLAKNVKCECPCESKWRKRQPYLVMQGWAKRIEVDKRKNEIRIF